MLVEAKQLVKTSHKSSKMHRICPGKRNISFDGNTVPLLMQKILQPFVSPYFPYVPNKSDNLFETWAQERQ